MHRTRWSARRQLVFKVQQLPTYAPPQRLPQLTPMHVSMSGVIALPGAEDAYGGEEEEGEEGGEGEEGEEEEAEDEEGGEGQEGGEGPLSRSGGEGEADGGGEGEGEGSDREAGRGSEERAGGVGGSQRGGRQRRSGSGVEQRSSGSGLERGGSGSGLERGSGGGGGGSQRVKRESRLFDLGAEEEVATTGGKRRKVRPALRVPPGGVLPRACHRPHPLPHTPLTLSPPRLISPSCSGQCRPFRASRQLVRLPPPLAPSHLLSTLHTPLRSTASPPSPFTPGDGGQC